MEAERTYSMGSWMVRPLDEGQDVFSRGTADGDHLLASSYYNSDDTFQNFAASLPPTSSDQPTSFFDAFAGGFQGNVSRQNSGQLFNIAAPLSPTSSSHTHVNDTDMEIGDHKHLSAPSPSLRDDNQSVASGEDSKKEKRAKVHREAEKRRRQKIEESLQSIINMLPLKARLNKGLERGKKAEALMDVAMEIKAMKEKLAELEQENQAQKQKIVDMQRQHQESAVQAYPAPFLGRTEQPLGRTLSAPFLPSVFEASGIPTVVVGPSSCRIAAVNSAFRQLFGVHYRERKSNGEVRIERDTTQDTRKPNPDVAPQPPCELTLPESAEACLGKVDDECRLVPIAKRSSSEPSVGTPLVPMGAYVRSEIDDYSGDTVYVVVSMSDIVHRDDRPVIVAATKELEKEMMDDKKSGRRPETRSRRVPARFSARSGLITALTTLSVLSAENGGIFCVIQLTPIS